MSEYEEEEKISKEEKNKYWHLWKMICSLNGLKRYNSEAADYLCYSVKKFGKGLDENGVLLPSDRLVLKRFLKYDGYQLFRFLEDCLLDIRLPNVKGENICDDIKKRRPIKEYYWKEALKKARKENISDYYLYYTMGKLLNKRLFEIYMDAKITVFPLYEKNDKTEDKTEKKKVGYRYRFNFRMIDENGKEVYREKTKKCQDIFEKCARKTESDLQGERNGSINSIEDLSEQLPDGKGLYSNDYDQFDRLIFAKKYAKAFWKHISFNEMKCAAFYICLHDIPNNKNLHDTLHRGHSFCGEMKKEERLKSEVESFLKNDTDIMIRLGKRTEFKHQENTGDPETVGKTTNEILFNNFLSHFQEEFVDELKNLSDDWAKKTDLGKALATLKQRKSKKTNRKGKE